MGETNLVRTLQNPGGSGKDAYVLIPSVVSNSAMGTSTSSIHPTTQPKPTPSAGQNVKSQTIAMDEISKGPFARTQDHKPLDIAQPLPPASCSPPRKRQEAPHAALSHGRTASSHDALDRLRARLP